MSSSTGDDDNNVVKFPPTPEERRALQRARQEAEQRRVAHLFVDEASGQALFRTPDGECYADAIIAGVRETWPIKSKKFRAEYMRHIRREFDRLIGANSPLAAILRSALSKASINTMIDEFESKAICSPIEREVRVRVASDGDDLYIDIGDPRGTLFG
jgi:hypothetical protein